MTPILRNRRINIKAKTSEKPVPVANMYTASEGKNLKKPRRTDSPKAWAIPWMEQDTRQT